MSSNSMIQQLIKGAEGKFDQAILDTDNIGYFAENLDQAKIPALIINNRLPLGKSIDMKDIENLREKGIEYYPPGRTGMPSLVTAEDGLSVPGGMVAATDKNLLELSVLGTYVVYLNKEDMLSLLNKGTLKLNIPDVVNIVLKGETGQFVGGIDIALYLVNYFNLSKNSMLEFQGEGLNSLPLNERFNLARTLIDLGFENLIFQVDEKVMAYLQDRTQNEGKFYFADTEAPKNKMINIELQKIHPMIAWNENDQIKIGPLTDKDSAPIDLIFIGGDNAARYADIQDGLKLVRYHPLADNVAGSILPGSQLVYGDLLDMGIAGILTEIGFDILPSSFMELLSESPDKERIRLGTSLKILHSGGMTANALSCFSAAMTGRITHPLELESILEHEEEHQHEH